MKLKWRKVAGKYETIYACYNESDGEVLGKVYKTEEGLFKAKNNYEFEAEYITLEEATKSLEEEIESRSRYN